MKRNIFTITFIALQLSQLHAQSIDSLVHEALQNNPQLRSLEFQITAAERKAESVGALPPPSVGVEFSQIPTSSANVVNGAISNNISVSQMFMLGGKLGAMSEAEQKRADVIRSRMKTTLTQLRNQVQQTYFQLWLVDRKLETQRRILHILQKLNSIVEGLVSVNHYSQSDAFALQAEKGTWEAKLLQLESEKKAYLYSLNVLLGRNNVAQEIVIDSVLAPVQPVPNAEALSLALLNNNPSLAEMNSMISMNQAEISAAQKEKYPDLMVQGMIMRMPQGMLLTAGSQITADVIQRNIAMTPASMNGPDWMYSVMFSVTLPFAPWSSARYAAKEDELQASNQSIEFERLNMSRIMTAQIQEMYVKYESAQRRGEKYQNDILPLSRKTVDALSGSFQSGQIPITTILDAMRMLAMREEEFAMVIVDAHMAASDIEFMVGKEFKEN
ncbi:MAG: TolC family protein [Bacteroidota bacterium]|nr:TolC family protein [Bacteroidota bacterium]